MRTLRTAAAALSLATAAQLAVGCTFKSALGGAVATAAVSETSAAAPAAAPSGSEAPTAAPAAQGETRQGNEFRWAGQLAAGRVVEIKGVNGDVRAEGTSGGEVEVVAVKRARRSDPESVRVEVVEHADGVTICAVYPNSRSNRPNRCAPGDEGSMSTNNNDVEINFTVRVPAGVRFSGRTVNGGVEVEGLQANVEAYTVNGDVSVSTSGVARAGTVNGSITATMGRADWQNELSFETVNGGIDLRLPSTLSADLRAETLNGQITTDFPLTSQGSFNRRRVEGMIGSGGRELRLRTVNGNVEIRRAS